MISASGLAVLAAPGLDSLPEEFRLGMKSRASILGDVDQSAPESWVAPFQQEIHAMAILASDDPNDLEEEHQHLRRHIAESGVTELGLVDGNTRTPEPGHEHFGFKDGISQPAIAGVTSDAKPGEDVIAPGEFILGQPSPGEPAEPPPVPAGAYSPTPPPAQPAPPDWTANGSYLVFRRLFQDVQGFKDFVTRTSAENSMTEDLLGAKLVGRYKSGAPLEKTRGAASGLDPESPEAAAADSPALASDEIDNFDYDQDPDGKLMPRAAHIRKTNPRSAVPPGKDESNRHRILRRGIPYGPEIVPGETPYGGGAPVDGQDRGLLFLCYQSSIANGFEFIQSQWANQDNFPHEGDGRDPIISQDQAEPKFTIPRGEDALHLTLARWVITTGGEYFFSPSITGIKQLSGQ